MNLKVIYTMLSRIMLVSGAMMALPLAISLIMGGPILAFIFSMAVAGLASVVLKKRGVAQENNLTPREGTAITALSWLLDVYKRQGQCMDLRSGTSHLHPDRHVHQCEPRQPSRPWFCPEKSSLHRLRQAA